MRAKKTRTEIRQEQIARAALHVADRHGLSGLSVARVAKAVGVVPSGLYRHYKDKDGVLETVLDSIGALMEANVAHSRCNGGTALDRLHRLLMGHVDLVCRNSAIPRVVFSDVMVHGGPAHRRRTYEIVRGYLAQVEQIIREGQREGSFSDGTDPQAASMLFLGLVQPGIVLWTLSDGAFDIRTYAEANWKLFLAAISERRNAALKQGRKTRKDRLQ